MNIYQLKHLIDETHKHGLKLQGELAALHNKGKDNSLDARLKRSILRGLQNLNRRRWRELAGKEHVHPFTMYDTITPSTHLPDRFPEAVAGYVGGKWPSFAGLVKRYPHAKHLSIAVNAHEDARCLDVETGDARPDQAPAWVRRQHSRGIQRPIVYANSSTMPSVLRELARNGIPRAQFLVWTAHYTHVPHVEPGSDATQWGNVEARGANYDVSRCESWFL